MAAEAPPAGGALVASALGLLAEAPEQHLHCLMGHSSVGQLGRQPCCLERHRSKDRHLGIGIVVVYSVPISRGRMPGQLRGGEGALQRKPARFRNHHGLRLVATKWRDDNGLRARWLRLALPDSSTVAAQVAERRLRLQITSTSWA